MDDQNTPLKNEVADEDVSLTDEMDMASAHAAHADDGVADLSRRGFLGRTGMAAAAAAVGMNIPFERNLRDGWVPVANAEAVSGMSGKNGLKLLNDRPLNAETLAHMLDDAITPTARHFIRNNGIPPENADASKWTLRVDGLVDKPMDLTIADLKDKFEVVEYALQIECGGNGRSFFDPPARGNQWSTGAVGCSKWTGVRLADVLKAAGVKDNVVYTAHEGADTHLSGKEDKLPISRGVPIEKAMDPYNLIAFEQNGAPLHPMNGAPLRLVVPGWPGSCSQKWLTRVYLRDQVHDGPKMTGSAYRVPAYPVAPGEEVPKDAFEIIHSMKVKSLITRPQTQFETAEKSIEVGGHAWAGDRKVKALHISMDFGVTWQEAELDDPVNPFAWQNWRAKVEFPQAGYYEVWARATDEEGDMQPFAIAWNPKGYMNNSMHRIAVRVKA